MTKMMTGRPIAESLTVPKAKMIDTGLIMEDLESMEDFETDVGFG